MQTSSTFRLFRPHFQSWEASTTFHVGIAAATVVSSWLNASFLAYILLRRGHLLIDSRLYRRIPGMIVASLGMGLGLFASVDLLAQDLFGTTLDRVLALIILVVGGIGLYGILALALRVIVPRDLKALYKGIRIN